LFFETYKSGKFFRTLIVFQSSKKFQDFSSKLEFKKLNNFCSTVSKSAISPKRINCLKYPPMFPKSAAINIPHGQIERKKSHNHLFGSNNE
jgi:hypothetical protein